MRMADFGEQLGALIIERRTTFGMTQADLVEASGVSEATIRPLEKRGVMPKKAATRAKIARALRWRANALDLLADGETPTEDWEDREGDLYAVFTEFRDLALDLKKRVERLEADRGGRGRP